MPKVEQRVKEAQKKEQDEVMGKLKDLGNTVLGSSFSVPLSFSPLTLAPTNYLVLLDRTGKFGLSTDNFKFVEQPGGGYSMNFER